MAFEFKEIHRVAFAETDMAGIMHFANFFRHMESTEHAFYRSLGLCVDFTRDKIHVGWPRVSVTCDYKAPLRFEEEFEVHLLVTEKRSKSLKYTAVFRKLGGASPVEVARGTLVVVSVAYDPVAKAMKAVPIPREFDEKIEAAPPDALKA